MLNAQGVTGIFGPGTPMESIIQFIRTNVKPRGIPA
jgi:methylmalonyl-CoA mutase C-terminal domain/subunit